MAGGNRNGVEQAEAHRFALFRMVAGRSSRNKGIVRLARHDIVHGSHSTANGRQHHLQTFLGCVSISLKLVDPVLFLGNLAHDR